MIESAAGAGAFGVSLLLAICTAWYLVSPFFDPAINENEQEQDLVGQKEE